MAKKAKRSNGTAKSRASASRTRKSGAAGRSARREWSSAEDKSLKTLIKQNTPTRLIAMKLNRTEAGVRQHVFRLGLSLRPTNRSPYG